MSFNSFDIGKLPNHVPRRMVTLLRFTIYDLHLTYHASRFTIYDSRFLRPATDNGRRSKDNLYAGTMPRSHDPIVLVVRRAVDRLSTRALHLQRAGHHQLLSVAAAAGDLHPPDLRPDLEPRAACRRRPRDDLGAGGRADRRGDR